jgi:AraC-like DNA-binding protein
MEHHNWARPFKAGIVSSIETSDFDEFCGRVADWRMEHHLIEPKPPVSRLQALITSAVQIGQVRHSSGFGSLGAAPSGAVSFLVTTGPRRPVSFRGRFGGALDVHSVAMGAEFELLCPHGSKHVVVAVSAAFINHAAIDLLGRQWSETGRSRGLRFSSEQAREHYVNTVKGVMAEVRRQPQVLDEERTGRIIADRISDVLLLGLVPGPFMEPSPCRQMAARRARAYLMERLHDPPSVRELCRVSGTSYVTLERGFKETYGLSPRTYLKGLRLARVRRDLSQPDRTTTVTGVALRWGFLELGRFAGEYLRRFGDSPSETLRRARAAQR